MTASPELVPVFSSSHFVAYGVKGDDVRGEYVCDRAEEWYEILKTRLGAPQNGWVKLPIYVYPTHDAFVGSTGEEFGEKLVGRAYSGGQKIELDASEMYAPMQRIIGHELTHIMVFRILGHASTDLPLWMNEGIAKVQAEEWDDLDSHAIADAAASDSLPRLSELSYSFPKGEADLSYAVSASMVRFIGSNTKTPFIKPMLGLMARGESFDEAVQKATGKTMDDWEKGWKKKVVRTYAPFGWIRLISVVAGITFPALAVAAYIARRKKQKKYLEQYHWEDGYDPAIDREYWPEE